ncbi:DUF2478 domain-containing protein [Hansschlegelia quercus]|uniref:DUF2478 domain-containing protein n=1 Tax=Hansschlegelia quercus TaxID=2528245 RepID=A0A4Q9GFT9_9HYPH|nr:DUF2478 domain-containing protein [Hansschlegelia quercus]TBN51730.1 DUF2478 domain-containing protein [Hansschlegelia quercus]
MTERIIALQGAASFVVQTRLASFARARAAEGLRVVGVLEEFGGSIATGCAGRALRDLKTERRHMIGQDLGKGSLACHLDASAVAEACQDVLNAIEAGPDVVVLAKFGKLESARSGLIDAFAAAAARNLPVVTSVAPVFAETWQRYSAPLARFVQPTDAALETWWRALTEERGPARRFYSVG